MLTVVVLVDLLTDMLVFNSFVDRFEVLRRYAVREVHRRDFDDAGVLSEGGTTAQQEN